MEITALNFSVSLAPGEKLSLPQAVIDTIGPGRWTISISANDALLIEPPIRDHSALLNGYAPEDEGLYDDFAAR
jgi:hypothetical protein